MVATTVKEAARRIVDQLDDAATWDDVQYQIDFRRAVEAGLKDSNADRVVPLAEARQRFGLDTP